MTDEVRTHVDRIVERLRKDHPDPKMREKLYEEGDMHEYVRTLMPDQTAVDDATIAEIATAVRDAEDGQSAE